MARKFSELRAKMSEENQRRSLEKFEQMQWHENTKFRAVIVRADNPSLEHQRLPDRDTVLEAKLDIDCFNHQCRCEKEPRPTGCLRYTKVEPRDASVGAYIDNDRGARTWVGSHTVAPHVPKEEDRRKAK